MATLAPGAMRPADRFLADQAFFVRMSTGIFIFVAVAFAQWSLRGMVDFGRVPIWVHLHGLAMLSWLALFATQNRLAQSGAMALHRKLGWSSIALAAFMLTVGTYSSIEAIALHRKPPFFTDPYFLALGPSSLVYFAGTLGWALARRKDTEWHRRLMLVATVLLLEPAFGRLLPMPLLGEWGPWTQMVLQAGILGIAIRHDRRVRGAAHPALVWGIVLVVALHVTIHLLAANSAFAALAQGIAAG